MPNELQELISDKDVPEDSHDDLKWWFGPLAAMIFITLFVSVGSVFGQMSINGRIDDVKNVQTGIIETQKDNRVIGVKNRAATCRLAAGLGFYSGENGDPCADPAVLKYYDPETVGSTASFQAIQELKRLVCLGLSQGGTHPPECSLTESP